MQDRKEKPILVTAATGRQGGAVVRRLLVDGWHVRGLTRNPGSAAARTLARRGVEVVRGDLDDPASLAAAMEGAHGVYSIQDFWECGLDREIAQGKAVADAAQAAGVRHLVYSSVGGAERTAGMGITHFEGKAVIEAHIRSLGIPWTILRPVTFFENFITPRYIRSMVDDGLFRFPFPGGRPFQMVAVDDIGAFAGLAFADPDQFVGLAIEIASDVVAMEEFGAACGAAIGRPVRFRELPLLPMELLFRGIAWSGRSHIYKVGPSIAAQARWAIQSPTGGWNADMDEVRRLHPGILSAREWAWTVDWAGLRARLNGQ